MDHKFQNIGIVFIWILFLQTQTSMESYTVESQVTRTKNAIH